jgi:hypothetical protein
MTALPHFLESAAFLLRRTGICTLVKKKRSPIVLIGALKSRKTEKEVTNEAYWRPKIQENRKRGHQ